jgi:hypothetical protein
VLTNLTDCFISISFNRGALVWEILADWFCEDSDMGYRLAKDRLTRDEIVDILKRNVEIYRNEPQFLGYIVDLALYLVEYKFDRETPAKEEVEEPSPYTRPTVYKVFSHYSAIKKEKHCHLCGAPMGEDRKCPVCGNVAI